MIGEGHRVSFLAVGAFPAHKQGAVSGGTRTHERKLPSAYIHIAERCCGHLSVFDKARSGIEPSRFFRLTS